MSPRVQAAAGIMLALAYATLGVFVDSPIMWFLTTIMLIVGLGMAVRDLLHPPARPTATVDDRTAVATIRRAADIAWWRRAAIGEHPAERAVAPAILAILGDTVPPVGAEEAVRPPRAVLERAAELAEADPSSDRLRRMAGTWEAMMPWTSDPGLRSALRLDIAAARYLESEVRRLSEPGERIELRTASGEIATYAVPEVRQGFRPVAPEALPRGNAEL